jgi:ABC-type bacteriocin/lantibiotic exporter with double-glycine peptidase domain
MKDFIFLLKKFFFYKRFIFLTLFSFCLSIIEIIALSLFPLLVSFILNPESFLKYTTVNKIITVYRLQNDDLFLIIISLIIIIFLIKNIFSYLFFHKIENFLIIFKSTLSTSLFKNFLDLPFKEFAHEKPSKFVNFITHDCEQIKNLAFEVLITFKELITVILLLSFFLIYLAEPQVVFFLLAIAITSVFIIISIKEKSKRLGVLAGDLSEVIINTVNQSFASIKDIKIYDKTNLFKKIFNNHSLNFEKSNTFILMYGQILKIFLEFISIIALVLFIFLIFYVNSEGVRVFEKLVAFVICIIRFTPAFSILNTFSSKFNYRRNSLKTVSDLIKSFANNQPNCFQNNNKVNFNFNKITLVNLEYKYDKKILFDKFNFDLILPKKIGIYGESGSGKSTFANILCGLLNDYNGSVKLDGHELKYNVKNLQKNISYVPQEIFLMNDTIKNNIIFEKSFDEQLFKKCCILSGLDNFINKFSESYDYNIGYDSSLISGGQKQRIGFARALYQEKPILVLDESVNALDEENEKFIIEQLEIIEKKLIVLITHKKSNLKNFDIILKFENKKIIQEK